MISRVFISSVTDREAASQNSCDPLRTWLSSELNQINVFCLHQEVLSDRGVNTLVKLAFEIESKSDLLVHICNTRQGAIPDTEVVVELLRTLEDEKLRNRFPCLFKCKIQNAENYKFLSYTQWEIWLAKFYHKEVLFIDFEDDVTLEKDNGGAGLDRLAHIHLLKPYAGHPIKSQTKEQVLTEIHKYLLRAQSSSVEIGASPVWPNPTGPISSKIANRGNEIETFLNLYSPNRKEKALFLYGPSNRGKSTLLEELYRQGCAIAATACGRGDFKNAAPINEVLATVSRALSSRIPELEGSDSTTFLDRLVKTRCPTVLLLDTYEDATDECALWIETVLLPFVGRFDGLRVVVAGQKTPEFQSSWSGISEPIELLPINEVIHWNRYRDDLGKTVTDEAIKEVVESANGEPGIIGPQIQLWK